MSAAAVERVRAFLKAHPEVSYMPASLAKAMRRSNVAEIREALQALREAGEVVTCRVMRNGLSDEEFRISAGGRIPSMRAYRGGDATAPRRGPRGNEVRRQKALLEFVQEAGRPVFPREIIERFTKLEGRSARNAVYMAICYLKERGQLAFVGKRVDDASPYKGRVPLYATPEIAARVMEEFSQGNGGEAGEADAGRKPAAPSGDEALRPSAEKTTPKGAGVLAGPTFGLLFGFMPGGSLAIRSEEVSIDLSPRITRELLAWLGARAGTKLPRRVLP